MAAKCVFDVRGQHALCIANDSRLSLFNVANGGQDAVHFSEKAHLLSGYDCVAWCPDIDSSTESRKLVALGAHAGVIVIWDVTKAEVLHRFGGTSSAGSNDVVGVHTSRIVDVIWCTNNDEGVTSHKILSCAEGSGVVNEWHWDGKAGASHRPRLSRSFTALKRAVTRLAAPSSSPATLFAAGDDVAVMDLATGKRAERLAGHSTPATSLAISTDGMVLVSAADERVLHLWDIEAAGANASASSAGPRAPTCVLAHPGRPVQGSVRVLRAKKNVYHVLAVGEDGTACIWRYKRNKGPEGEALSTKPVQPCCSVTLDTTEYDAANAKRKRGLQAERPAIIAATIVKDEHSSLPMLLAAVGPLAAPTFYSAAYCPATDASRPLPTLALSVRPPSGSAAAVSAGDGVQMDESGAGSAAASAKLSSESIADARGVAGARTSAMADGTVATAIAGKKRKRQDEDEGAAAHVSAPDVFADVTDADIDGEWTLGRNVQAVIAALRNPAATDILGAVQPAQAVGGGSAPTSTSDALLATGSLASVLSQALSSGDDAQLELVLSSGDKGVQDATVSRLAPPLVLQFLARLIARFQAKPSRGAQLLCWTRSLLTCHAGYLLGVPGLVPALEPLYTLLDARLAVLKKLLKLQGRLDLLLAQVAAGTGRAESTAASRTLRKAKVRVAQEQLEAEAALGRRGADEEEEGEDEEEEGEDDEGEEDDDDEEEDGEDVDDEEEDDE